VTADPYELDEELDCIVLGTTPSPGMAKVSGHDRFKAWDVQAAKGTAGASSNLNGDPIGQFTVTFFLAKYDDKGLETGDFENWENFRRLIESMTEGPTPVAMPIYHPRLAEQKFTEVSSGGIGGAVEDGLGGVSYAVKFIEYKPPQPKASSKAKAKPAGVLAAGNGGQFGPPPPPPPDPNAAAKAELQALKTLASVV
jgi:hypothetical protein